MAETKLQELSDEELMRSYQDGEQPAFEELFHRHSGRVLGFLISRTKDRIRAEDVFQATFLKLHQARHHYDPSFPFAPWLFTICKSVLTDHQRKQTTIKETANEDAIQQAASVENAADPDLPDLDILVGAQRAALELRYSEDLPFDEIAERLKTSPSNVRQLISRAVRKLRESGGKK